MTYLFTPPAIVSLPIRGSDVRFPVGRVFCLGRNYPWPETYGPAPQEPVFFMKPASNVVRQRASCPSRRRPTSSATKSSWSQPSPRAVPTSPRSMPWNTCSALPPAWT